MGCRVFPEASPTNIDADALERDPSADAAVTGCSFCLDASLGWLAELAKSAGHPAARVIILNPPVGESKGRRGARGRGSELPTSSRKFINVLLRGREEEKGLLSRA